MAFELDTTGSSQSESGSGSYKEVDWAALNKHVVDTVDTQKKAKTVVGFISGLYDLGMQPRPDFEKLHDPSKADEVNALADGSAYLETKNYYDDGTWHNDAQVFCKPRTPAKAVALAVDFPQFVVDKGQFFGNSSPAPLRLVMGGTWSVVNPNSDEGKKMPIIATPFYLAENTNNPSNEWSIGNRTTLFKMGAAADLLNDNGNFKKESVGGLLGKALLFKIQVYMKPDKYDASKSYYTESIKFVSEIPEGLPVPEFDNSLVHGLNMNKANEPDAVKQVRATVKNTMSLSADWDDSVIKQELEANSSAPTTPASTSAREEEKTPVPAGDGFDDFDDEDIPFSGEGA